MKEDRVVITENSDRFLEHIKSLEIYQDKDVYVTFDNHAFNYIKDYLTGYIVDETYLDSYTLVNKTSQLFTNIESFIKTCKQNKVYLYNIYFAYQHYIFNVADANFCEVKLNSPVLVPDVPYWCITYTIID